MAEATTNEFFCTICQEDDISKHASVWCFECEDFLCSDCSRVHRRSKSLKEHKLTTIEDYRNLPQFVLDIKNRCPEHDQQYELYCSVHESACCITCSQEVHKECRKLRPIREVLENFKSSAAVSHLEEDLQKIEENLNKVVNYLKHRRNKNQEQSSEILKEIRRIRGDVNAHFDKIEQKILDELKFEQKTIDDKLDKMVNEIEEKSRQITTIRDDFSKMTRHATDLQTYIGLKRIESIAEEEENYLTNLVDNPEMKETSLTMEVSNQLKTLVRDIASFGKIVIRSSESTLIRDMKLLGQQSAQLLVQTPKTIHELQLTKKSTIQVPGESITGCTILPEGKMAFALYTDMSLLLHNGEGEKIGQTAFSSKPFSCAYINNNQIAVSIPKRQTIQIIDIKENKSVKEIQVEGMCWDIHTEGRKLLIRINDRNVVQVLDLDGDAKRQNIKIYGSSFLNITVFNDKIYCSNLRENTVYCYDMKGTELWKFQHHDCLEPLGIASDNTGFVYVACRRSHKIMVISPDGKDSKVLLNEKDGLVSPEAIHINRDLSLLLVGSKQKAFLFNI